MCGAASMSQTWLEASAVRIRLTCAYPRFLTAARPVEDFRFFLWMQSYDDPTADDLRSTN